MDTQQAGAGKSGVWKIVGVVIVAVVAFSLFYITIPAAVVYYLYWKNKTLPAKAKHIIAASVIGVFALGASFFMYGTRTPTIALASPQDGATINMATTTIEGSVSPSDVDILINGRLVIPKEDGKFTYTAKLQDEVNRFTIEAENAGNKASATLTINRTFTPEQLAQREQEKKEAEAKAVADAAAQKAKEQADLDAYYATKGGRICKAHPEWSKDDCELLADGKIWIGMEYDMLVYRRGRPDHINPSNYGSGIRYQYCWSGYQPSCFYDENADGLIDAYN